MRVIERDLAIVALPHAFLAALIGLICVAPTAWVRMPGDDSGVGAIGLMGLEIILLPLVGIVLIGIRDWRVGRGSSLLRATDIVAILLGGLILRSAVDLGWWLGLSVGSVAAFGMIATFATRSPRRAGWRH